MASLAEEGGILENRVVANRKGKANRKGW